MAAAATPSLVSAEVVAQVGAAPYACIVGFGSLLSEASAMLTCPGVRGFRLARVRGWRRVFAHPAHIFFARGIAVPATREIASLSAEPQPDGSGGFVVATFQVPTAELGALLEREEEFNFARVPFFTLPEGDTGLRGGGEGSVADEEPLGYGYMCTRSTDAEILDVRGHREKYTAALQEHYGFTSIWDEWGPESGILPTPVYCRHCVLAASKEGVAEAARNSFLDETFIADRHTTLRQYLETAPHVMASEPPPELAGRYSG